MLTLQIFKHQSIEFRFAELGLPSRMSVYDFYILLHLTFRDVKNSYLILHELTRLRMCFSKNTFVRYPRCEVAKFD